MYTYLYIYIYVYIYIYIYTCISYMSTYLPSFSVVIPEKPAVLSRMSPLQVTAAFEWKAQRDLELEALVVPGLYYLLAAWGIMKSPIFIGIPWNHYEPSNRMEWNMFFVFRCSFACQTLVLGVLLVPILVLYHHSEPYPFCYFLFWLMIWGRTVGQNHGPLSSVLGIVWIMGYLPTWLCQLVTNV